MRLRLNYCIYKNHVVGAGGFGKVVLATVTSESPLRRRLVAVKYIDKRTASNELDNIVHLTKAAVRRSVGIMEVYDYVLRDKVLISPLYGPDLGKCVPRHVGLTGVEVVQLLLQMLSAIGFCHEHGVMHMDVKPGNFVVSYTVPHSRIFLIDFGLSQRAAAAKPKGRRIGSPRFMSFNMHAMGVPTYTDDYYSVVFTVCALLNGALPWKSAGGGSTSVRHTRLALQKRKADLRQLLLASDALRSHLVPFYERLAAVPYMDRVVSDAATLYTSLQETVSSAPRLALNVRS